MVGENGCHKEERKKNNMSSFFLSSLLFLLISCLSVAQNAFFYTTSANQYQNQVITCPNTGLCYVTCLHPESCKNTTIRCPFGFTYGCYINITTVDGKASENIATSITVIGGDDNLVFRCYGRSNCEY